MTSNLSPAQQAAIENRDRLGRWQEGPGSAAATESGIDLAGVHTITEAAAKQELDEAEFQLERALARDARASVTHACRMIQDQYPDAATIRIVNEDGTSTSWHVHDDQDNEVFSTDNMYGDDWSLADERMYSRLFDLDITKDPYSLRQMTAGYVPGNPNSGAILVDDDTDTLNEATFDINRTLMHADQDPRKLEEEWYRASKDADRAYIRSVEANATYIATIVQDTYPDAATIIVSNSDGASQRDWDVLDANGTILFTTGDMYGSNWGIDQEQLYEKFWETNTAQHPEYLRRMTAGYDGDPNSGTISYDDDLGTLDRATFNIREVLAHHANR